MVFENLKKKLDEKRKQRAESELFKKEVEKKALAERRKSYEGEYLKVAKEEGKSMAHAKPKSFGSTLLGAGKQFGKFAIGTSLQGGQPQRRQPIRRRAPVRRYAPPPRRTQRRASPRARQPRSSSNDFDLFNGAY